MVSIRGGAKLFGNVT